MYYFLCFVSIFILIGIEIINKCCVALFSTICKREINCCEYEISNCREEISNFWYEIDNCDREVFCLKK